MGVILKLVSPDYRISQPSPSTTSPAVETDALTVSLIDCIKVSFSVGPVMDVLVGNEARLPLEYADLRQVKAFFLFRYCFFLSTLHGNFAKSRLCFCLFISFHNFI